MGRNDIPPDVTRFIGEHLRSITQLDVLLLLRESPDRWFSAQEVSRRLRAPERLVNAQLLDLLRADVLVFDAEQDPRWRFHATGPHAATVAALREAVRHRKRAVHDLILAGLDDDVQAFSDAFRLRRRD
jgi:hypothetical protein